MRSKDKRMTKDEVQAAIGRSYAAGVRDGHVGRAFLSGSWLSETARTFAASAVEGVVAEHNRVQDAIEEEYATHYPKVRDRAFELGNGVREGNQSFACANPQCYENWPCRTWHLLRRIHGWDSATYSLDITKVSEED